MRVCCTGQRTGYVTLAILGVPPPGEETLPGDVRGPSAVIEVDTPDVRYHGQAEVTERLSLLSGDACPERWLAGVTVPLVEARPEPLASTPRGSPLVKGPQEPLLASSAEPLVKSMSGLVMEAYPDPLLEGLGEPLMDVSEPVIQPWKETWSEPLVSASREPLVEASSEPLTEAPRGRVMEVIPESLVGACPAPFAEAWAGSDFVARVLDECLELEKNRKPTLCPRQELEVVRMATAAILTAASEQKSKMDLSISDFEGCSFRCLKLALLIREWRKERKHGGFTELIARLEELVSRPAGLSDTWFLAGVIQMFSLATYLYRWLPLKVSPRSGWGCRKMVFRVSLPDGIVRLPEDEGSVKRVCACSKLIWWFHQAIGNIRSDEETWLLLSWPPPLFRIYRDLGKRTFDDAIGAMRHIIRPPLHLSNFKLMACLLKYVETTSPMIIGSRLPKAADKLKATCSPQLSSSRQLSSAGDPLPSSFSSSRTPACSAASLVNVDHSAGPTGVDPDSSVAAEMTSFMAGVLRECAERESNEKAVLTVEMKLDIARFASQKFQGALLIEKLGERQRRNRDRFEACGWRWLCLAGLMNDHLKPELLRQMIAASEKIVPRPKHVSPLWYLACQMQTGLRAHNFVTGFRRWLKVPPAWWQFSCVVHRDHFPHEFGELPMSETSARLITFSSRAAHWLATGIGKSRLTPSKTWKPGKSADIVNIFHKVLGDQRFSQMIDLVKPKFHAIIQAPELTDKSIMDILFKCAKVNRRTLYRFCKAWQASERSHPVMDGGTDGNSSEDDPPPKKACRG
ncbi:hypothetical protein GNI_012500 [Gregarina niphandrodes]|uniref:Uncharacterized protein n=1 Tax=Gregarina niphandrodes TaxID=110365 RepID=A0A023BCK4_GRENI|nr:hypothetical protein GNI_012500 [Gregarina niphandrodes]EZG84596.1 hypothetical protein GNI_012500 [Gregarina niphandrodes]|eukprot:XP_011128856.1 hypothetical protein GNI_012500 [Gregarina niphandrodes]